MASGPDRDVESVERHAMQRGAWPAAGARQAPGVVATGAAGSGPSSSSTTGVGLLSLLLIAHTPQIPISITRIERIGTSAAWSGFFGGRGAGGCAGG